MSTLGGSVHWGIHKYIRVHWGHEYIGGGGHEYIGGCSVHQRDTMSTLEES